MNHHVYVQLYDVHEAKARIKVLNKNDDSSCEADQDENLNQDGFR
jgi:hypothetical protein